MLEYLIENIFVMLNGYAFQQTLGILTGTNYGSLLGDIFLYSSEADLMQGFFRENKKKLAWPFDLTFRCIDDVLSLNNSKLGDYVDRIYPIELERKKHHTYSLICLLHCELSNYIQHPSNNTCLWNISC
jgi:hypothetical protein